MRGSFALLLLTVLTPLGCGRPADRGARSELLVYAAASLGPALAEIVPAFEARHDVTLRLELAGSNLLARQILAAPAADLFLSADEQWMDELMRRGALEPRTRRGFLGNGLVVIAARESAFEVRSAADLARLPLRLLAVADPDVVPAGRYARASLEAIRSDGSTLWQRLLPRLLPTQDVRAALHHVESDPELVGIVYRSDARSSDRVRVLLELDVAGPPISYAAAALAGRASSAALGFLDHLGEDEAQSVFERYGFERRVESRARARP